MALNPKITDWKAQRVWLVGASTGIGAALATLLLDRGARVAVSARTAAKLDAMVKGRANALAVPLDVTDAPGLVAAHAAITK